jgi:putative transposase
LKKHDGEVIREVLRQRGIELMEGHPVSDHIHMCVSLHPKHSVAFAIGVIKGKSALSIHPHILGNKKVTRLHFWSRGYFVSKVGLDEQTIEKHIREEEAYEKHQRELQFNEQRKTARDFPKLEPQFYTWP